MSSLSHSRAVKIINIGLKIVWVLNFAFLAFISIFTISLLFFPKGTPNPVLNIPVYFSVEEEIPVQDHESEIIEVEIENASGQLLLENPKPVYIILFFFGSSLIKFFYVFYVLYFLRKIWATLLAEKPFVPKNGKRLGKIAIATIIYGLFMSFYNFLTSLSISSKIPFRTIDIMYKFELRWNTYIWGCSPL